MIRRAALLLALLCGGGCGSGIPPEDAELRPRVEEATGWTFGGAPDYDRIDREGLLRKIEEKIRGEPERRIRAYGRVLRLLGALPGELKLLERLKRAQVQEVLALYDPADRKVYLVEEVFDAPLSSQDRQLQEQGRLTMRDMTLAHELVHALQDQEDPLLQVIEQHDPDTDDLRSAVHAFMEGEATIQMFHMGGLPAGTWKRSVAAMAGAGSPGVRDEHPYIRRVLYFPYVAGAHHVLARIASGGIAGRAADLHAAVPVSTEQLLHPERGDAPVAVFLPDLSASAGGGRELTLKGVMGEAELAFLLHGERAAGLSSGLDESWYRWGGDRLHFYEKPGGKDGVAVLLTHWDTLLSAYRVYAWAAGRRREGRPVSAAWNGRDVAVVAGLPPEEGGRLAREAAGRAVKKPFRSLEELRAARREAACPEEPAALKDLSALVAELMEDPSMKGRIDAVIRALEPFPEAKDAAARYRESNP